MLDNPGDRGVLEMLEDIGVLDALGMLDARNDRGVLTMLDAPDDLGVLDDLHATGVLDTLHNLGALDALGMLDAPDGLGVLDDLPATGVLGRGAEGGLSEASQRGRPTASPSRCPDRAGRNPAGPKSGPVLVCDRPAPRCRPHLRTAHRDATTDQTAKFARSM